MRRFYLTPAALVKPDGLPPAGGLGCRGRAVEMVRCAAKDSRGAGFVMR